MKKDLHQLRMWTCRLEHTFSYGLYTNLTYFSPRCLWYCCTYTLSWRKTHQDALVHVSIVAEVHADPYDAGVIHLPIVESQRAHRYWAFVTGAQVRVRGCWGGIEAEILLWTGGRTGSRRGGKGLGPVLTTAGKRLDEKNIWWSECSDYNQVFQKACDKHQNVIHLFFQHLIRRKRIQSIWMLTYVRQNKSVL